MKLKYKLNIQKFGKECVDDLARIMAMSNEGGGSGSSNYNDLSNKPKVNGVEMIGNKTGQDYQLYKVIASENHTTIQGYYVPVLTSEQITEAYNYVVAGKHVVINDAFDYIYLAVEEATNVGGEITIKVLFRDALILTYKLDGTIEATAIGGIQNKVVHLYHYTDGTERLVGSEDLGEVE